MLHYCAPSFVHLGLGLIINMQLKSLLIGIFAASSIAAPAPAPVPEPQQQIPGAVVALGALGAAALAGAAIANKNNQRERERERGGSRESDRGFGRGDRNDGRGFPQAQPWGSSQPGPFDNYPNDPYPPYPNQPPYPSQSWGNQNRDPWRPS